jgi:HK97 family phage prohead protease
VHDICFFYIFQALRSVFMACIFAALMEKKRIILSNEGLNSYGFRVKTGGIKMDRFMKNPVLFLNHSTWSLPVGKWEDLKVEGGTLTGVPVFDMQDERGAEAARKYQEGFLNAASISVKTVKTSNDAKDLVLGQKYETITECELMEVSLVGIPSNPQAIRLSTQDQDMAWLSAIPALKQATPEQAHTQTTVVQLGVQPSTQNIPVMKELLKSLGLPEGATEAEALLAVQGMQTQLSAARTASIEAAIQSHLATGAIGGDEDTEVYKKLYAANFEATNAMLSAKTPVKVIEMGAAAGNAPVVTLSGAIQQAAAGNAQAAAADANDRSTWTHLQWSKEDPKALLAMKQSEPEKYKALKLK